MTPMLRVLHLAHKVVEEGGVPLPCILGVYCLRCCISKAKARYDSEVGVASWRSMDFSSNDVRAEDLPLVEARDAIAKYDACGIAHSRGSALALLEKVMIECSTSVE